MSIFSNSKALATTILLTGLTIIISLADSQAPTHADTENPAKRILGYWRNAEDPKHLLLISPKRILVSMEGILSCRPILKYEKDRIVFRYSKFERKYRFSDGFLITGSQDSKRRYERLATPPKGLNLKPYVLGASKAVPEKEKQVLRDELKKRFEKDQAVRKGTIDNKKMLATDLDNSTWLRRQIEKYGWIDSKRFGFEAAIAAFFIAHHSQDFRLMLTALPEAKKECENGDPTAKKNFPSFYGGLRHRIRMIMGEEDYPERPSEEVKTTGLQEK